MTQQEIFLEVIDILNNSNIPYMITGALAVSYYGMPRLTHDLDIIIQIDSGDVDKIFILFSSEFYISKVSIEEAIEHRSTFNIIHLKTSIKVDFWMIGQDEYEIKKFSRRSKENIFNRAIYLITPEDLLISKLDWYKMTDVDKHYIDCIGIYKIQKEKLDINYIKTWTARKSTLSIFEEVSSANLS